MSAEFIYHICTTLSWDSQSESSVYSHESLALEQFIHCSERHQIAGVLERYFKGQNDLLVLTINPAKLTSKLQYEKAPIGELFPHIYGPINKDAIVNIKKLSELEL